MGLIFEWKIDNISFYPYGGVTKFNEDINRPLKEELLILLMGPLTQIIYYLIIINFISLRNINIFRYYHYSILIFNLLPIYPLDGGRILNIFLSYFFSYKNSLFITVNLSFVGIILLTIVSLYYKSNINLNLFLMISLIIVKLINYYKKRKYYLNKFKLERYLNNYSFNKLKKINNIDNMMRDKRHIIKKNNKYYTEKELLQKRYSMQKY